MGHSDALRVRSTVRDPITYLELTGQVDESFDPSLLLSEARTRVVVLNLKGISRLTSFGVREWTNAMRELGKRAELVYWSDCSPSIVTQLNMVANFSGNAQIVSVLAPLYCEMCGWETNLTVHTEQGREIKLPQLQCEQCTAVMAFDDDPATYFAFPTQRGIANSPADQTVLQFLRAMGEPIAQPTSSSAAEAAVRAIHQASMPPQPASNLPRAQENRARPKTSSAFAKAQPILVGIAIPAVIATAIALTWPSSDELPEEQQLIYQEHLKSERFADAKVLIEKSVLDKKISAQRAKTLEDEIVGQALIGYGRDLVAGEYEQAAVTVSRLVDEKVLPPTEGTRLHKEISKTALTKYRELASGTRYVDAEALAKPLERKGVLPPALRSSYSAELSKERERLAAIVRRDVLRAYKEGRWNEVLEAAKTRELFGPLDDELSVAVAESNKKLSGRDR